MRKIYASKEMGLLAHKSDNRKVQVYSFFPVDRANCACKGVIDEWKKKLGTISEGKREEVIQHTKHLVCPASKIGMRRRAIICNNCNEVLGYCWSTDNTLKDWVDFHYVQWTDGEYWRGCLAPHISPITQELCLECCCGQDTRDFRVNMTLSAKVAFQIEEKNKIGRAFGRKGSKFRTRIINTNMIPFGKEAKNG